ncbi:MAG: LuxR C-terminal-related transcriptional regulator [Bacteroidales bacterium]|jgi:AraC family chitin signaling transcriptional activator|nr:LuxR C-terminal-related transcriptional regulator [Bacteroidales bacterium]
MRLKYYNRFYYFILFLILLSKSVSAQYSHYFQNYSLSDYKAANQNWDITKSGDGKLYVANNDGLLEYDGLNWNFWELPNRTTIRSILEHKNKIYVGSYEEFGFFERNNKGDLEYTSLLNIDTKIDNRNDEAFWEIILYKDALVFRSFSNIYIYKDEEIISLKLESVIMSCDVVNDKLYVSSLDNGIFILENQTLVPYFYSDELYNTKTVSIVSKNNNQLLINTELKGCFILENYTISPFNTEINPLLKKYQLNRYSQLQNGNMIFGTIKNGVYITDNSGNVLYNINKDIGLINNTVLGQHVTNDNILWLGLDNGIAFVDLNSPNYYYNDISGKLGAVYDVINYNDTIYIGSNTGLYFVDENEKIEFIEGSQGHVWSLQEIEGELFCCHNNGTYLVKKNKIEFIPNSTGAWIIKKVPNQRNIYLQGTYSGLSSFIKTNGEWKVKHLGETTLPVKFLVFEDEYIAWIGHANKGLFRVKFNNDYSQIIDLQDYINKGIWTDYYVKIYNLKNTIAFHTKHGWQKYEPLVDSIVPYDLLNENIGKNSYIISEEDLLKTVFKTNNSLNFGTNINDFNSISIPRKYYNKRLNSGNENVSRINDTTAALNLYDGFMLINTANFSSKEILEEPRIAKIVVNNQLIELNTDNITLPFRNNNIKITVTAPFAQDLNFEYKLSNINIYSTWTKFENGLIEFSNLSDGEYLLSMRTVDNHNNISDSLQLEFSVTPPWFKDTIGFLLYSFIFLISGSIIYLFYVKKINKEQKLLQIKYEESQKKMLEKQTYENEKAIIKLRNDSLRNDIKLKSKQLANTAMALVKKNETLLQLKNDLLLDKDDFKNQYSFKKLIRQIDYSIEHEDQWDIFESNFNQVHEEFFNQLKIKFPNLTRKDLKMCAFLKMDLSTKEIAPLLNISIRGIETHRYRLKRKLDLEKNEDLCRFLQSFH